MSLHLCVSLWKCKKIQIPPWHRHFPSLLASSDNLSVCGLASLARRKPRFPRGRTSLRFLKGTKITVHEFLTKRRFRKTRNAIAIIFLGWQLTLIYNWNYNCLRTGLCTNILRYCFLCASCWKTSYNYILMILPSDKSSIERVLNVKLKKSGTFQAKYFHNTEESIMAAMINKMHAQLINCKS